MKIRSNKVISRNVTEETVVRSALVFKLLKLHLYTSVFLPFIIETDRYRIDIAYQMIVYIYIVNKL